MSCKAEGYPVRLNGKEELMPVPSATTSALSLMSAAQVLKRPHV